MQLRAGALSARDLAAALRAFAQLREPAEPALLARATALAPTADEREVLSHSPLHSQQHSKLAIMLKETDSMK